MFVFIMILCLMICAALVALYMLHMEEIQIENRQKESYIWSMKGLYATLYERIEATRQYRHDLAKHIQTLEVLLSKRENQNEGMLTYIEDLRMRYEFCKEKQFCADEIINAMLSVKHEECREKKIPFEIEIEDVSYAQMQEIDLVGLIYNLLDNAIEANERISEEKKGIHFSMRKDVSEIYLHLENQIPAGKEIDFKTSKLHAEEHGFGTKIIDEIVDKYHGTKKIEVDKKAHRLIQKLSLQIGKEG